MKPFGLVLSFSILLIVSVSAVAQKLTAEEIVTKHLASIGTKEARSNIKSQILLGDVQFRQKGNVEAISGKFVIVSAEEKTLWGMNLNSNDYPQDRFGYDGKDVKVGFATPGTRSFLGSFINSYKELLKEGLLGGSLTTSWILADTDLKNARLSYDGTKKIDGKENLVVSYSSKKGSDLSIKMYFDKETFQHLRTEYNRVIAARQGTTVDTSASQGEERYKLVEDFSNFKSAGGLILPATYKISYSYFNSNAIQSKQKSNRDVEWTFNITNFTFNPLMDADSFDIEAQ